MITSKQLGQASPGGGERVFRSLPSFVCENLTCLCEVDFRKDFIYASEIGINQFGTFCSLCGKPRRFSIANYFFICEGCETYFTYDFREFKPRPFGDWIEFPPVNLLCKDCDVDAPKRKRKNITFH